MARIDELESGLVDQNGEQVLAELRGGKEFGDPVPKAPPVHMQRPESQAEIIKRMVRQQMSAFAASQDFETFEEADDFDIDDDRADPHTPYEAVFDPQPDPPPKEKLNGDGQDDKGRGSSRPGGTGQPDPVGKSQSGEGPADDAASVRGPGKAA